MIKKIKIIIKTIINVDGIKRIYRNYISIPRYRKLLKKYKYIHLMVNGIHFKTIMDFINKYFDNGEHCFVFPSVMFPATKEKCRNIKNVFDCPIKCINPKKVDKIIIQGLFDQNLVNQLYKSQKILQKCYWFIWGGDLYSAHDDYVNNFVRKNVAGILTSFDKDVYTEKYGEPKSYYDVTYPSNISEYMLDKNDYKTKKHVHLQINNSADESTLEMLDILSKFKNEKIKISTILSYKTVGQKDVVINIIKKGYEIFGNKFNPIIEFMPKEEYAKHLASVDIYISNQNRQQGNGNASFICSLGKKVFVKSDTSVYKKYNSLGIRYFDTYSIAESDFKEFLHYDAKTKKQTVTLLKERMKDETKVKQWTDFFDTPTATKEIRTMKIKNEKERIAKKCLEENLSPELIAKITGLTESKINKLRIEPFVEPTSSHVYKNGGGVNNSPHIHSHKSSNNFCLTAA